MTPLLANTLDMATVPEHSLPLMAAAAGSEPLITDNYLFYKTPDALLAIGYPLDGRYDAAAFAAAVRKTQAIIPGTCFAIAPDMPAELNAETLETDRYYVLGTNAKIPQRLVNCARQAAKSLTVSEDREFTPAHRRLWGEFLERTQINMNERVAALYARTPQMMATGDLTFLNAYDADGNLAAALLLDQNPVRFTSYVLGAHSRRHYAPHAMDLLFFHMLEKARELNKRFIHLGLGVNEGILRFKKKWGAVPSFPFTMAAISEARGEKLEHAGRALALAVLRSGSGISARQMLQNEPEERPFAMLWRIEKNNRVSWLGGTAHFFCASFASSFRRLYKNVDNVIFEGPLDAAFMAKAEAAGRNTPPGYKPLLAMMTEAEITALERMVRGPRGGLARILAQKTAPAPVDVRSLLAGSLPWHAFFTLWTSFLERLGWRQSVDMEAYNVAREMGKKIIAMENLEEQMESLGSLPVERALNFFRACSTWPRRAKNNRRAYLAGDLERMMGSSAEFPTRTEHIVGRRDQRFRERMRPFLEQGRTAVFVGSAHLVNLRPMLIEDGFTVRQTPFGLWPKLHLKWRDLRRPDGKVTW